MDRVLLLDDELMKMVLPIDANISKGYIRPAIVLAQDMYLEETIGTRLTNTLKEYVVNGDVPYPYKALLDRLQKMLAHYACAFIIENVGSKIANAGVMRTEDEKMLSLSSNDIESRRANEVHYGDMYRGRVQRFLIAHYGDYPELMGWRSIDELRANLSSSATCGLWLGGARGKGYGYSAECNEALNMPNSKK